MPDSPQKRMKLVPVPTVNGVVAANMSRARKDRGWSQEELGEKLGDYLGSAWSVASVSAAERSVENGRARHFHANELVALSMIFEVPVSYFFLPPDSTGGPREHFLLADSRDVPGGTRATPRTRVSRKELTEAIAPTVMPDVFVDRLRRLLAEFGVDWTPGEMKRKTPPNAELVALAEDLVRRYEAGDLAPGTEAALHRVLADMKGQEPG